MKTKKKHKAPNKPTNTGTWYKSLIEGKSKAEYYRHFLKKLNDIITEYFGAAEALRVLKAVDTGKITVPGIESFLFDFNDISEQSRELYNTCKSAEEFVTKSIISFKKKAETGETDIYIKDFFFMLADLLSNKEEYSSMRIKEILTNFVTSLITVANKSPYVFIIVEPHWAKEIGKQMGLSPERYTGVAASLINIIQELMEHVKDIRAYLPQIKIVYPVYYDVRDNQLIYLTSLFRYYDRAGIVRRALEHIPDLSLDTPALRSGIEYLKEISNLPFINTEAVILELQSIGETDSLKRYPNKRSLVDPYKISMPKNYYNKFDINPLFINKETFEKSLRPYFCEVQIDCAKLKRENIESFIDVAKTINLTKGYYAKTKRDINSLAFKITLLNVKEATEDFMKFIRNKLKRIESSTNKNFLIEVCYDSDTINQKIPEDLTTCFRIISDIHADYNREHGYHFNFGNDFVINCGDTAGNSVAAGHWILNYMRHGVTIIGNHLGYSSSHPELDGIQNMEKYSNTKNISNTKENQIRELFNILNASDVALLSNTCSEYQGVIIIGTCLYTDFNLYGEEHREECMAYAKKGMNDFRLPVTLDNKYYTQDEKGYWWSHRRKDSESKIRPFDITDHAFYFHYSLGFIKQKVEEHKNKPIIIVTHHIPSPYAISEEYRGSLLNAAFASNLNQYIVEHPQIRVWAFGHTHKPFDFILGETRLVCCPFGYNNENNFNLPYEYGLRIPIEDVKSKKSWKTLLKNSIDNGTIQVYEE